MFVQTGSPCIYYGTEMGMTGSEDPDCRKPMDWSKKDSPIWKKVHALIEFRLKYATTLGKGKIKLTTTPEGLIKVERQGQDQITAYFNTTSHSVKVDTQSNLSQNYENGQLKAKGFVITVKH